MSQQDNHVARLPREQVIARLLTPPETFERQQPKAELYAPYSLKARRRVYRAPLLVEWEKLETRYTDACLLADRNFASSLDS